MNISHERQQRKSNYWIQSRLKGTECTRKTHVFKAGAEQYDLCDCGGWNLSSSYGTGFFIKAGGVYD